MKAQMQQSLPIIRQINKEFRDPVSESNRAQDSCFIDNHLVPRFYVHFPIRV